MPPLDRLIVFTRFPAAGRTKTRMIPLLGAEGAADLQRAMTEHLLRRMGGADPGKGWEVEIRFAGASAARVRAWLGPGYRLRPQGAGDIGRRMQRSLGEAFAEGCARAAVVGTDIPEITAGLIQEAFAALAVCDLVLGPAADGGYYLLGLRRQVGLSARAALFAGIPWGGPGVLEATLAAAAAQGLTCRQLTVLADVDRPEDWPVWERARRCD